MRLPDLSPDADKFRPAGIGAVRHLLTCFGKIKESYNYSKQVVHFRPDPDSACQDWTVPIF
jgi:hypothetical protein